MSNPASSQKIKSDVGSKHIVYLLFLGPRVCRTIEKFRFEYKRSAEDDDNRVDVPDEYTIRLAKACPKLKEAQIQGTTKLGDDTVQAYLQHWPLLTKLEVSSFEKRGLSLEGAFFTTLKDNPA
jgi:hypothetical protein